MKYYSKEHEWVKLDDEEGIAVIGITSYAAKSLGDVTYVELPREGTDVIVGDTIGVVESVKAASDVYSPVSGTVVSVNKNLEDDPGIVNASAEERGWMCKLDNVDESELEDLMEEEDYKKFIATLD